MLGPTKERKTGETLGQIFQKVFVAIFCIIEKKKVTSSSNKDNSSRAHWNVTSKFALVLFLRTLRNSLLPPPRIIFCKMPFFFFKAPWNPTERKTGKTPPHVGLSSSLGPLPGSLGRGRGWRLACGLVCITLLGTTVPSSFNLGALMAKERFFQSPSITLVCRINGAESSQGWFCFVLFLMHKELLEIFHLKNDNKVDFKSLRHLWKW